MFPIDGPPQFRNLIADRFAYRDSLGTDMLVLRDVWSAAGTSGRLIVRIPQSSTRPKRHQPEPPLLHTLHDRALQNSLYQQPEDPYYSSSHRTAMATIRRRSGMESYYVYYNIPYDVSPPETSVTHTSDTSNRPVVAEFVVVRRSSNGFRMLDMRICDIKRAEHAVDRLVDSHFFINAWLM